MNTPRQTLTLSLPENTKVFDDLDVEYPVDRAEIALSFPSLDTLVSVQIDGNLLSTPELAEEAMQREYRLVVADIAAPIGHLVLHLRWSDPIQENYKPCLWRLDLKAASPSEVNKIRKCFQSYVIHLTE
jgi:hypothetical protein